ncbi:hypothetical protein [Butyrivibrio sp. INlla21]|uniref:hypothetical protein n=1 Tax=Butyrivibrio sp. INlla21 TaxID=1520811 RepID=UPI0008ECC413|nr:hypothetical protein [Butyrivibrio sp. INlla21]SFU85977.1 hypothetical protein SAMN02910342_02083 [Butyrivibrio sp. INlla21]
MKIKMILPIAAAAMMLTACTSEAVEMPADETAIESSTLTVDDVVGEKTEEATKEETTEASTVATSEDSADAASSTKSDATDAKSGASVSIDGTWSTASIGYMDGDDMQPEWYVQFKDSSIDYGHKKNGEFVVDHSDKIDSAEKTANGYKIQATSSTGVQYTLQTAETDSSMIEYYETWDDSQFPDAYRGGSSLSKCTD